MWSSTLMDDHELRVFENKVYERYLIKREMKIYKYGKMEGK